MLLFSATMPQKIQDFAQQSLICPILVNISWAGAANLNVLQVVEYVKQEAKMVYLLECLQKMAPLVIVFSKNKNEVDDIQEYLLLKGVRAVAIHESKSVFLLAGLSYSYWLLSQPRRNNNMPLNPFFSLCRFTIVCATPCLCHIICITLLFTWFYCRSYHFTYRSHCISQSLNTSLRMFFQVICCMFFKSSTSSTSGDSTQPETHESGHHSINITNDNGNGSDRVGIAQSSAVKHAFGIRGLSVCGASSDWGMFYWHVLLLLVQVDVLTSAPPSTRTSDIDIGLAISSETPVYVHPPQLPGYILGMQRPIWQSQDHNMPAMSSSPRPSTPSNAIDL